MNTSYQVNRELSRSFGKFGMIVLAITLVMFIVKSFTGYYSVTKGETYDNCVVRTSEEVYHSSRGGTSITYYVTVIQNVDDNSDFDFSKIYEEGEEYDINSAYDLKDKSEKSDTKVLFNCAVPKEYYKLFVYNKSSKVTFYNTSFGRTYPVSTNTCGNKQAQREYTKLDPPVFWYGFYFVGLLVGLFSLRLFIGSKKTSENYDGSKVYEPPVSFEDSEDALEAMAVMRIRQDKAQMYREQNRYNRYRRRF